MITRDRAEVIAPDRVNRPRSAVSGFMVVVLLAAVIAGCGRASGGLGRLTIDGQVQLAPAHGRPQAAKSGQVVKAGDEIQVVSGNATIRLEPNGLLELRDGAHLTMSKVPLLRAGAALIEPGTHGLSIASGTSTLNVPSGAAQVSRVSGGLTAKVYRATSTLEIPGNPPLAINAARQTALTMTSVLPIAVTPLSYDDNDIWDRRYLGLVESFGRQLDAAATGFDAQLAPGQGHQPIFYQQLVPALAQHPDFVPAFLVLQQRQPLGTADAATAGDYLIATVIALHGTRLTLADRMHDELVFRAQKADWGLVAYDQGVTDLLGVLNDVLAAIGRATLPFAGGSVEVAIPPPAATTTTPAGPSRPVTTPTTVSTPKGSALPRQTTTNLVPLLPPAPVPAGNTPIDRILNPLLNPLIAALNALIGGRHR